MALRDCQGECLRFGLLLELIVEGLGVSDEVERVETRGRGGRAPFVAAVVVDGGYSRHCCGCGSGSEE